MVRFSGKLDPSVITHTWMLDESVPSVCIRGKAIPGGLIYLAVKDPRGKLRGTLLLTGSEKSITISSEEPTFGCVQGPILPGEWTLLIHEFIGENVSQMPENMSYEVSVEYGTPVDSQGLDQGIRAYDDEGALVFDMDECLRDESGWYRGDFHAHTILSDGHCDLDRCREIVRQQKLDFLFLTDHNLFHPTLPREASTLFLPAVEVSTDLGHANVFCPDRWFSMEEAGATWEGILKAGLAIGGIRGINHPCMFPWKWTHGATRLADITSLEICCDPSWEDSPASTEQALELFSALWNAGVHTTAVGGSDAHLLPEERNPGAQLPELFGDPMTWVYGEKLSARGILEGVQRGHTFIERQAGLSFSINQGKTLPGERVNGPEVAVNLSVSDDSQAYFVEAVVDGKIKETHPIDPGAGASFTVDLTNHRWLRLDIRREDGQFEGLINPVFTHTIDPTLFTWEDLLRETNQLDALQS